MSKLLYEDEDWLLVKDYVHSESDEYSQWELDDEGVPKYEWNYYSLYEADVIFQIDKKTGESYLLQLIAGDQVLEPV